MPRLPQAGTPASFSRSWDDAPLPAGLRQARPGAALHLGLLLLLSALIFVPPARAAETSEPAPLAAKSLLLDVTRAGSRLVAVGDRGHVLLSDDEGATWRQVIVPTRAMLTGVSFGDATHGWAVGHDGVILATSDAGATWIRQNPAESLETIFLDVLFTDATHGIAVGAYGKCLATADGGVTWQPVVASEFEAHFNQITVAPDAALYLSGESGSLLTSRDGGRKWTPLAVPYDGSLFGLLALTDHDLLVYGLRGHVYVSDDRGRTWAPRETDAPVLIMAGVKMKSGAIVLAGLGGNFYVNRDGGAIFASWMPAEYNSGVSALLEATDGALVVVGEKGAARLQLPIK